jgi:hypothetical protein
VSVDDVLDAVRKDVLAADDDHVVLAVNDVEIPLLIESPSVQA